MVGTETGQAEAEGSSGLLVLQDEHTMDNQYVRETDSYFSLKLIEPR